MHIVDGIGDVKGLVREHIPEAQGRRQDGASAPAPASRRTPSTTATSRRARRSGCTRRRRSGATGRGCCSCRSCAPHFPLTAPPQWFYRYWQQDLPMPKQYAKDARPHHPFLDDYAHTVDYDPHFASDGRRQAGDRRLRRPRVGDGRERRLRAARAARRGPRAATRA